MRMNKLGNRSVRNFYFISASAGKVTLSEFCLASHLVDYQLDHIFCCCAVLRDKAKEKIAVKVGGMEWEIQRVTV